MKDNRFTVEGFTNALTGKIKKQMNKLEIEIPEGHEIDQEKSNLDKGLIIFKKKKSRPMSFKEIPPSKGFIIDGLGVRDDLCLDDKYIFSSGGCEDVIKTFELAKAFVALNKLIWLRDEWNEGWEANWDDENEKACIFYSGEIESVLNLTCSREVLSFKDIETAKAFLDQFRDLIKQAKPLL